MSNFNPFGQAIGALLWICVGLGILAPLGIWKLVESLIWLYTNVDISVSTHG